MAKVEHFLENKPSNFSKMNNGDMVTQSYGDKVVSYLKSNNQVYSLKWDRVSESDEAADKGHIGSENFLINARGWRVYNDGDSEFATVKSRISINSLNWSFFTGTAANKQLFSTIPHGVTNGKKRILAVSTNIQSDTSPNPSSGTIPTDSFLAGAGNIQDESDEDREFASLYDDTNVYIFIDSTSDDVAGNRYTCAVFYADYDLY